MCIHNSIKITVFLLTFAPLANGCTKEPAEEKPETKSALTVFMTLPAELNENSGMIWFDGLLWIINDSSGEPCIYAFDTISGEITRQISVREAINTDWEEIAQDNSYLYIGDFGNNDGSRKDLRIYRISKNGLNDTTVTAEAIQYQYADQTDFTPAPLNTTFDCEAMICYKDTLFLFSKNWIEDTTRIYRLPSTPGKYDAIKCGQLSISGQVTAAAYLADESKLYLLGYKDYIPFVCSLEGFIPGQVFSGTIRQHLFTEKFGVQTEGIAVLDQAEIIVSCEKGYGTPQLFRLTWAE